MNHAWWSIRLTGFGLAVTLFALVYLFVAWPEGTLFSVAEQLLDATHPDTSDSKARLDYIVRDLQYRAQAQIVVLRITLGTLLLDALLFGYLLVVATKLKRAVTANAQ